jgi:hypothetical protein
MVANLCLRIISMFRLGNSPDIQSMQLFDFSLLLGWLAR